MASMNWKLLIDQLQTVGINQTQIALACGCRQPTISDIYTGKTKNPTYSVGSTIKELHQKNLRRIVRIAATQKTSQPLGQAAQ